MSRRRAAAVFVALTAFAGSLVSQPASAADDVASVNGESISVDDFEDAMATVGAQIPDYAVDGDSGTVTADAARDVLSLMIGNRAQHQFLERHGIREASDDARQDAEATLDESGTIWEPGVLRNELVNATIYSEQLSRVAAPEIESLRGRYEVSPLGVGALCARPIPVLSPEEADAIVDALAVGEDIAEGIEVACVPMTSVGLESFDIEAGQTVGPLPSQDGSAAVYIIATFDESIDALTALFDGAEAADPTAGEPTAGDLLFIGWMVTADITVNPRYGRWDAASASIVPLGQS